MTYVCERCNAQFEYKSRLLYHLSNKKKICPPLNADIDINEYKERLEKVAQDNKKYPCKKCGKGFSSPQTRCVHHKNCTFTGIVKNDDDVFSLKKEVEQLQEKIKILENGSNNINYHNTNNINIQINVRDFCINENTEYLKSDFLLECFRDMDMLKIIEEVHFNLDHPENHNCRTKNIKQNLMEYQQNGKWIIDKKENVLYELIMNGYRVLNTYYKDNKKDVEFELDNDEISESLGWLKKIYHEDKTLMKELKNDAFLLVINNKALLLQKK